MWATQRSLLNMVRSGENLHVALEKLGVSSHTFTTRWKHQPQFRHDLDEALAENPMAMKRRRAKQKVPDFLEFRAKHFAYWDKLQAKWVRSTNSFYQHDAAEKLASYDRLVMVLPPGHIKTTMLGIERAVWSVMRDRNWRGLHISKNQEEAAKVVAAAQERLECAHYHYIISELKAQGDEPITCPVCAYGGTEGFRPPVRKTGQGWGKYSFTVNGRTSGEKDFSFEAKGYGSQIQGVRSDCITIDDLQDPESAVRSQQDSTDKLGWVQRVILGRLARGQQLVVLANFFSPTDFAHLLIEAMPQFPVVQYSALRPCPGECPDDASCSHKDERVMCPEFWDWDSLERKRKEVGEQVWFFTWMQEEGDFEETTFKRSALEAARTSEFRLGEIPHDVTDVFMGVDPATAASGHCAIVVWGLDRRTKQRYLIDVFNETGMVNYTNIIAQIEVMGQKYSPIRRVVVERNAQQAGGLINEVALDRAVRGVGSKIQPYQTVTGLGARAIRSNFDITIIGGLYDGELISLPYGGNDEENARVDAYITQHCNWRTDDEGHSIKKLKRDMVMATLFAESEAFALANRADKPKPSRRPLPRFVRDRFGPRPERGAPLVTAP